MERLREKEKERREEESCMDKTQRHMRQ